MAFVVFLYAIDDNAVVDVGRGKTTPVRRAFARSLAHRSSYPRPARSGKCRGVLRDGARRRLRRDQPTWCMQHETRSKRLAADVGNFGSVASG